MNTRTVLTLAIGSILAACGSTESLPTLPQLKLDPARTSVSGMSSGAYMAHQLHLAYSDRIHGAALFAGGPYACAQGGLNTALASCMAPAAEAMFDLDVLEATVRDRAASGALASLDGLVGDRVYVWHGSLDHTVSAEVSEAAAALYQRLHPELALQRRFDDAIAHVLPTAGQGGECSTATAPYIAACGLDLAGEAIRFLYPDAPTEAGSASGALITFNAASYAAGDAPGDRRGLLYVPAVCAAGEVCGLHIAFHGCEQSIEKIGDAYARDAGFNRWADAAKLVVVYPQAQSSLVPLNPKACWDWWGYSGADYDTRQGAQLRWVAAMAGALGAPLD